VEHVEDAGERVDHGGLWHWDGAVATRVVRVTTLQLSFLLSSLSLAHALRKVLDLSVAESVERAWLPEPLEVFLGAFQRRDGAVDLSLDFDLCGREDRGGGGVVRFI
jgi:hypothetical protein